MNSFYKAIVLPISVTLMLTSCAGRNPAPISTHRAGDHQMSCNSLMNELSETEYEIQKRLPKESKTGRNVALGLGGLILWPAWFFMDFKDAEKVEISAYRARYNHLARIMNDKKCGPQQVEELPNWFEKSDNKPKIAEHKKEEVKAKS